MNKKNSGYSLVEVLIALAITSIVLLTVVTLFYMGKRNVYSGKQQTYAVSVGTRILEDRLVGVQTWTLCRRRRGVRHRRGDVSARRLAAGVVVLVSAGARPGRRHGRRERALPA